MSDVDCSAAAEGAAPMVQFTNHPPAGPIAETELPQWALAAQDNAMDGEAIDTLTRDEEPVLTPLVAAATFLLVEAELFEAVADSLVAFGLPSSGPDGAAEAGPILWSGAPGEAEPIGVAGHQIAGSEIAGPEIAGPEIAGMPGLFVSHGISLDWTDAPFGHA